MKTTWIALLGVLLLTACPNKKEGGGGGGAPAGGGAGGGAKSEADALDEAFSQYIKGYNGLIDDMKRAIQSFERAFPEPLTGVPERKPILVLGAGQSSAINDAEKDWAEAKKVTPKSHADMGPMADEIITAARALDKALTETEAYWDAEKYKDDGGAGGKELDARVRANIKAYRDALDKLDAKLKAHEIESLVADLAKHADDKTYGHQFRNFGLAARRFMDADDNAEKVTKAFAELDAAHAKLKAFADAKPTHPGSFDGYMTQVRNFHAQATKIERNLREQSDLRYLERDYTNLVSYYNNLISLTNTLYQQEGQGTLK